MAAIYDFNSKQFGLIGDLLLANAMTHCGREKCAAEDIGKASGFQSEVISALQQKIGAGVDGSWGRDTRKKIAKFANERCKAAEHSANYDLYSCVLKLARTALRDSKPI